MRAQFVRDNDNLKTSLKLGAKDNPKVITDYVIDKLLKMGIEAGYNPYTDFPDGMFDIVLTDTPLSICYIVHNSDAYHQYMGWDDTGMAGWSIYNTNADWVKYENVEDVIKAAVKLHNEYIKTL